MEIELAYKKLLTEHKLTNADLNEDAKTGIEAIKDIMVAVRMQEAKGKEPSARVVNKIKTIDGWICREIVDIVDDTNKNAPVEKVEKVADEVKTEIKGNVEEVKTTTAVAEPDQLKGEAVNAELQSMFDKGTKEISLDNLKSIAPTSYSVVFDSYETGADNGIKTISYSLLETTKETFTLSKN